MGYRSEVAYVLVLNGHYTVPELQKFILTRVLGKSLEHIMQLSTEDVKFRKKEIMHVTTELIAGTPPVVSRIDTEIPGFTKFTMAHWCFESIKWGNSCETVISEIAEAIYDVYLGHRTLIVGEDLADNADCVELSTALANRAFFPGNIDEDCEDSPAMFEGLDQDQLRTLHSAVESGLYDSCGIQRYISVNMEPTHTPEDDKEIEFTIDGFPTEWHDFIDSDLEKILTAFDYFSTIVESMAFDYKGRQYILTIHGPNRPGTNHETPGSMVLFNGEAGFAVTSNQFIVLAAEAVGEITKPFARAMANLIL